jgi:hypothetical protein
MTEGRADRPLRHRPPPTTHYVARSLLEAGGFRLRLHPAVAGGTFTGMAAKVKEQNLAVFGESGSGKTVLLSSFYSASQEPSFLAESLYKVLADWLVGRSCSDCQICHLCAFGAAACIGRTWPGPRWWCQVLAAEQEHGITYYRGRLGRRHGSPYP